MKPFNMLNCFTLNKGQLNNRKYKEKCMKTDEKKHTDRYERVGEQ